MIAGAAGRADGRALAGVHLREPAERGGKRAVERPRTRFAEERRPSPSVACALFTLALLGCLVSCTPRGSRGGTAPPATPAKTEDTHPKEGNTMAALRVTSPALQDGGTIPSRFTCDGDDVSPALAFEGAPEGTRSFALVMDDPDAPMGTWVHWVLWNRQRPELPEAFPTEPELDDGTRQGLNSWGRPGYGGPCPPSGTHRYFFRVYALDTLLDLPRDTDAEGLRRAIEGHVLAEGVLMGRYARRR